MIVAYLPAFVRDLKRLKGTRDYERIRRLAFEEAPAWQRIEELPQVKKLAGQSGTYRLRIGDYRIGFYRDGEKLTLARVLHRKEIYRFFP
jgi:mRNA-degrading endonuclease RelE of RelBE toxin-antitoxin system